MTAKSYFLSLRLLCLACCALAGCRTSQWNPPVYADPACFLAGSCDAPCRTEAAYANAYRLESERDPRCVAAYYEAAISGWNALDSTNGFVEPTSRRAWEIYHSSVAKLITTGMRFGQFEPLCGFHWEEACGPKLPEVHYHGFVWKPEDFNRIHVVGPYSSRKLITTYRGGGLGVPLVIERVRTFDEPMRKKNQFFSATAVLRPCRSPHGDTTFELAFFDPLRVDKARVKDEEVAIYRDYSAPYAFRAASEGRQWLDGLLAPGSRSSQNGLYFLEPYQPGKIPIILIHGLASDPSTWIPMANELQASPGFLQKYQLWGFEYPSGEHFTRSAKQLRQELSQALRILDPQQSDPALANIVMVGHSMGGLIAKLQVTDSQDQLWRSIANRPLEAISATPEMRTELAEMFFFRPQPAITRVIFIATPHRGANSARRMVGRLVSSLVAESADKIAAHRCLIESNPGVFSTEVQRRIPTSIDLLEPKSRILQTIEHLPIRTDVSLHSIIGTGTPSCRGPSDGMVPVSSARHVGVCSELFIRARHTQLQADPVTIAEVREILRAHAASAVSSGRPQFQLSAQQYEISVGAGSGLPNASIQRQRNSTENL